MLGDAINVVAFSKFLSGLPSFLDLHDRLSFSMAISRFKLVLFIPAEHTQNVLGHLFRKFPNDLGKIGNYEQCAFIQRGTGLPFDAPLPLSVQRRLIHTNRAI